MGLTEYFAAQKQGEQLNETLEVTLMEAYLALTSHIREGDVVKMDKLKDKNIRETAVNAMYSKLEEFATTYFGASTTDASRKHALVFGLLGLEKHHLSTYFEEQKEKAGFFDLYQRANKNEVGVLGYFMGQNIQGKPATHLSTDDAADVVKHTKTQDRIDVNKLNVKDMVGLLAHYKAEKTVAESFLKDKDYAIKKD